MTFNQAATRLRRALQAMVRALSAPSPLQADALAGLDDDTVFQPGAANRRAAPRIDRQSGAR